MEKQSLACLGILFALATHGDSQVPMEAIPIEGYVYKTPNKQFELPTTTTITTTPSTTTTSTTTPSTTTSSTTSQPVLQPFAPTSFPPRTAICVLRTADGVQGEVSGGVFVTQEMEYGPIVISGTVQGLSPGKHGFHLHGGVATGSNCDAAGAHFNPFNKTHGGPTDEERHAGDFGNIEANELGVAFVSIQVRGNMISVESEGMLGIIGKSIVIHAKEDDLGRGNSAESSTTGGSGARQACCVLRNIPKQPIE